MPIIQNKLFEINNLFWIISFLCLTLRTSATVRLRQNCCNLPLPISRTLSCLLRGVWERMMKLFPMILKSLSASFGYDPVSASPTFDIKLGDITRPEYTLEEIFTFLDKVDRRCLVVIDEFQQITNYPEKNVETLLRTHIQNCSNANFVFAGSQRRIMSEIFPHTSQTDVRRTPTPSSSWRSRRLP